MWWAVAVTGVILAVWVGQIIRAPRPDSRQADAARDVDRWKHEVQRRLPAATARLELSRTPGRTGVTALEVMRLRQPGKQLDGGWEWRVEMPGVATIDDVRKRTAALQSGLNSPTPIVEALDVQPDPRHQGWGTLRAYRRDPIHLVRPVPWPVGESPMRSPRGKVTAGVTRWGSPVLIPLWQHHWLVAGQNTSGKSSAVRVLIENVTPHVHAGTVRLTLVDVGKLGRGYNAYRPLFSGWHTDQADALTALEAKLTDLRARSNVGGDGDVPIGRANPLEVIVVEEAPALEDRNGVLTRIARQTRQLGGVLVIVTQSADARTIDTALRKELRVNVGFRCATWRDSEQVFGGQWSGEQDGPHRIPRADGWNGVCYVDVDGSGLEMARWWWVDEARARATACRRS